MSHVARKPTPPTTRTRTRINAARVINAMRSATHCPKICLCGAKSITAPVFRKTLPPPLVRPRSPKAARPAGKAATQFTDAPPTRYKRQTLPLCQRPCEGPGRAGFQNLMEDYGFRLWHSGGSLTPGPLRRNAW